MEELGLNVNFATFRTLDPSIGRWWQVDPMAEGLYGVTPYNSMLNNPVYYTDPDGDWVHVAIGAGLGAIFNVATHWDEVTNNGTGWNWGAFGAAVAVGAAGGALTAATGNLAAGATIAQGAAIGALAGVSGDFVTQGGNAMFFGDEFSGKQMAISGGLGALGGMLTSALTRGAGVVDDVVTQSTRTTYPTGVKYTPGNSGLTVEQIEEIARNGVMTVNGFSDDVASIAGNTVGSKFAPGIDKVSMAAKSGSAFANSVGANSLNITTRWIKHDVWNQLKRLNLQTAMKNAMDKGFANSRTGTSGIIRLKSHEIPTYKGIDYPYELKYIGRGHYRLYGRLDDYGALIFDYLIN